MANITEPIYSSIDDVFSWLNTEFFDGQLPQVAITLHRAKHAYGYFSPDRWESRDGQKVAEIALNPDHFIRRTDKDILSTLLHEMVHHWQFAFGKVSRKTYHNKQFAEKMRELGLQCSNTGLPGGKETGQKMSHYIIEGGKFDLLMQKMSHRSIFNWGSREAMPEQKKKTKSKVKYTCNVCGANAWAKPGLTLYCGELNEEHEGLQNKMKIAYMIEEKDEEDDE